MAGGKWLRISSGRSHRLLTVLFGRSGLGKTSLLAQGIFPKLRREGFLPVPLRLDFAKEAPELAAQVKSALGNALAGAGLPEAAFPAADETLWEYFHRAGAALATPDGKPLVGVLVFDQFEELFTLGRDDELCRRRSDRFLTELADLVENRVPAEVEQRIEADPGLVRNFVFEKQDYRVLISLREDFLPELESLQSRMSSLAGGRIRLTALNGPQALEAAVKPGADWFQPRSAGRSSASWPPATAPRAAMATARRTAIVRTWLDWN